MNSMYYVTDRDSRLNRANEDLYSIQQRAESLGLSVVESQSLNIARMCIESEVKERMKSAEAYKDECDKDVVNDKLVFNQQIDIKDDKGKGVFYVQFRQSGAAHRFKSYESIVKHMCRLAFPWGVQGNNTQKHHASHDIFGYMSNVRDRAIIMYGEKTAEHIRVLSCKDFVNDLVRLKEIHRMVIV